MIELIQLPYSPFCIVIRRILEYAGGRFKITDITAASDRSHVWRLTRQRYYQVPVIRDGRTVVFETNEDSQVIAKYLDTKLGLGLFPREWTGVQQVLWHFFEHEVEAVGFKLNNAHYREWLPAEEWLPFLRYKERRFGRGCLDQWREQQPQLLAELDLQAGPLRADAPGQAVPARPAARCSWISTFTACWAISSTAAAHELPAAYPLLRDWYARMSRLKFASP